MRNFTTASLLLIAFLPSNLQAQKTIDYKDALQYEGDLVRLQMKVDHMGRAGTALVLAADTTLRVNISEECKAAYLERGTTAKNYFRHQQVEVTGKIRLVKTKNGIIPTITVTSTDSIRIISESPQSSSVQITPAQSLEYVGKTVTVEMPVLGMGTGGRVDEIAVLRSKKDGKAAGNLLVRLMPKAQAEFGEPGIKNMVKLFSGKKVRVTGVVHSVTFGDTKFARIDLSAPGNIKILGPAGNGISKKTMKPDSGSSSSTAKSGSESDSSLPKVSELVNREVDLYLRSGQIIGAAKITAIEVGNVPDSCVSLKAEIGNARPRTFQARTLTDIAVNGNRLSLKYDRAEKALVVDQEARQQLEREHLENQIRLGGKGNKLWERLTEEEHAEWNRQHRDFAVKIQQQYPLLPLRVVETTYFLIVTDIAESEVNTYIKYLDKLYAEMCRAFGIPENYNIWCGKCVIVAFQNRPDFIRFEVEMMKNTGNARQAGGLCHSQSSGRVIISLFKKDFTDRFATVLVHETSHGMVARFLSDANLPSWLNEGMAVWIAEYIVPQDSTLEKSQKASVTALLAQQTLAGFFEGDKTPGDLYGCASAIVGILLEVDKDKFRQFVTDIKLGHTQESSLMKNYDLTFDDVTTEYGRRIGLPQLRK